MRKLVGACATAFALISLGHDLWSNYGLLTTLQRAALVYFVFYGVGSLLALVFRTGIQDDWVREDRRRRVDGGRRYEERPREGARRLDEKQRREAVEAAEPHHPPAAREDREPAAAGTDRA